ncbi:two-component system chemotaxis sensor kinase CheA [Robbsia andropogonis]|uniref:chemotaxis protein CheA n=3 Tax=Robbsia andropogonis TaxID=28092 RepID=UPI00158DB1DC|nr:chemotaxis protein CheA [Robbsia andropogonis]MCP1118734.1 chemotaxis protein CheA [Robbsia andropogonis]MCP1128201.1 chemotaxis protein CheA [Robbsia andropogonis]
MSLDITQFYETFFDEADELLTEMERLLLGIDVQHPDPEQLNAIFRAAHSIKGGAATFGFSVLAETTHVLESVLDQARTGELALRTDMVDVFLESKDVLEVQLRAYRESGGTVEPDRTLGVALGEKLKAVSQAPVAAPAPVAPAAAPVASAPVAAAVAAGPDPYQSDDPAAAPAHVIRQLHEIAGVDVAVAPAVAAGATSAPVAAAEAPAAAPAGAGGGEHGNLKIRLIDVKDGDQSLLVDELSNLGTVTARVQAGNVLSVWLKSDCSPDDIIAVCCFVIDEDQIEVSYDHGGAAAAAAAANVAPGGEAQAAAAAAVDAAVSAESAEVFAQTDVANTVAAATGAVPAVAAQTGAALAAAPAAAPPQAGATVTRNAPSGGAQEGSSIRVGVEKVDHLINLVGELVITQAMLAQTASKFDPVVHDRLFNGMALLERNARDLQEAVMSIRMMPMDYVFSRFPRLVRDLASKLGKKVDLVTFGQATELDKSLIERIIDPLTHLVRNSLDHGIETPDVRLAAGKEAAGELVLSAEHAGGNIVIEVSDDGAGLNRQRILAKAQKQGLAVSDAMTDDEVAQLIFMPGFSTAEQVTDISGRGVGMDVVKRNIQSMGGHVEIQTRPGNGTTTRIILPLTLAILDGMSVKVGGETFIVPLNSVMESMQPTNDEIFTIAGQGEDGRVLRVRGEYLPIVALHKVFEVEDARMDPTKAIVVIVQAEGKRFAMMVDELLGQHQVVVKNLETNYRKVFGISAATILGDGSVALILDVPALNRNGRDELMSLPVNH